MYFLITICIHVDGYEKQATHFITADSEEDACYKALCNETHNSPLTRKQYDVGKEWWDDCMIYKISGIRQIKNRIESLTLARYL